MNLSFIAYLGAQMQDVELTGAGTSIVNGTYTYMGQYVSNGHSADYYQKGSIYIYRLSFQMWPWDPITYWWRIGSSLGANSSNSIYYTVSSSQTYVNGLTFSYTSGLGTSPLPTATLSISINNWNGAAWSSGSAPGTSDKVKLSSSSPPGSFGANILELDSGIDLTIDSGDTVIITGEIQGHSPLRLDGNLNNFSLNGSSSNWVSGAGSTFMGSGTPANGLNFDGSNDYAFLEDNSLFDFSTGLTVEAWVKADMLTNHGSLVSKFANGEREFSILLLNNGSLEYSITYNGSTEQYFVGNTVLSAGNWYHVALTYDGSSMRCYVNGVADGTKNVTGTIHNGSSHLYIGTRSEGSLNRFLDGTLDEVRIWNIPRSQTDIQNNMNIELNGKESGLVAYYKFNQGADGGSNSGLTSLTDATIRPHDPNEISGSGRLVFDNNGDTLNLNNVKLNIEGVVQVASGTTLQTNDSLTLTASADTAYGQMIGKALGTVRAQSWIDSASARYHYLGSPFTNAQVNELSEGGLLVAASSNLGTIWRWNASNATWEAPSGLTDTIRNGIGYSVYAGTTQYGTQYLRGSSGPVQVEGTVANGNISVPLGYNDGQSASVSFVGGTSQTDTEGWNLLANPYPSQYNWSGQSLPAGMSNAFYINKGGTFSSYVNGIGTNDGSPYIAPFQAIWVQTTNTTPGNFTFSQAQRVTGPSTRRFKNLVVDGVYLTLTNNLVKDEIFVGFDAAASDGFDTRHDARKILNESSLNLFVELAAESFSICRTNVSGRSSFPLAVAGLSEGQIYSFKADDAELMAYEEVLLEDRLMNVMHPLGNSDYNFTWKQNYGPGRFVLHFINKEPEVGREEAEDSENIYAYENENGISVELGSIRGDISLYNTAGQLIAKKRSQTGQVKFPLEDAGLYLIKVRSGSHTTSLKVIL